MKGNEQKGQNAAGSDTLRNEFHWTNRSVWGKQRWGQSGNEAGRQVWERSLKDWFKESRVTTTKHHPISPLLYHVGERERVFVGIVHQLQKRNEEKKKTKVRKGGSREEPAVLCFAVRCHWVSESVTSPRSKENTGESQRRSFRETANQQCEDYIQSQIIHNLKAIQLK